MARPTETPSCRARSRARSRTWSSISSVVRMGASSHHGIILSRGGSEGMTSECSLDAMPGAELRRLPRPCGCWPPTGRRLPPWLARSPRMTGRPVSPMRRSSPGWAGRPSCAAGATPRRAACAPSPPRPAGTSSWPRCAARAGAPTRPCSTPAAAPGPPPLRPPRAGRATAPAPCARTASTRSPSSSWPASWRSAPRRTAPPVRTLTAPIAYAPPARRPITAQRLLRTALRVRRHLSRTRVAAMTAPPSVPRRPRAGRSAGPGPCRRPPRRRSPPPRPVRR